jgi:hypothetical protein
MAKYTRFDPRNKKNGRNKTRSLGKDFRIREVDDSKIKHQALLREVVYDEYEEDDDLLTEENTSVS